MAYTLLLFYCALLVGTRCVSAEFESAGCSDEGCGIPCYLKPPEDNCHYTDHNPCDESGATELDQQLWLLNNSLVRLQEKLVQKGIIPAGNTCPPLVSIDHGGIIYTDLLLSIGVRASYVCLEGYSLHGHGVYECSSDNQWIRMNDQSLLNGTQLPSCEDSVVVCEALVALPSGHISYQTVDTTRVQPGDVATYSCDTLYTLQGNQYRVCLRNSSWSGEEPICIAPPTENTTEATKVERIKSNLAAAVTIPIVIVLVLLVVVVTAGAIVLLRKRKSSFKREYDVLAEDIDSGSVVMEKNKRVTLARDEKASSDTAITTIKPDIQ